MRKRAGFASVFFLLSLLRLAALDPEQMNQVTFVNRLSGGGLIMFIFVAPAGSNAWGPNIVGRMTADSKAPDFIENGNERSFYAWHPGASAAFDALAVDDRGQAYVVRNFLVKDGAEALVGITDAHRDSAVLKGLLFSTFTVVNATSRELFYVFFAPSGGGLWGVELLNIETTLPAGDRMVLTALAHTGGAALDLLALDEAGAHFKKRLMIGASGAPDSVVISDRDRLE